MSPFLLGDDQHVREEEHPEVLPVQPPPEGQLGLDVVLPPDPGHFAPLDKPPTRRNQGQSADLEKIVKKNTSITLIFHRMSVCHENLTSLKSSCWLRISISSIRPMLRADSLQSLTSLFKISKASLQELYSSESLRTL